MRGVALWVELPTHEVSTASAASTVPQVRRMGDT